MRSKVARRTMANNDANINVVGDEMGCCTSKKVYPEPKTSAEPVLTNNDVEIIQKDWKVVEQDPQGNGLLLFRRLFEENPDVKAKFYFSMENSLDLDATMKDERMGKHAKGVIDTISVAVSLLQDLPTLVPILVQLGGSHAKFNLQDEHFKAVGDALIWTLENAVGSPLDNAAKDAWGKLLTVVTENMKKGFLSDDGEK